MTRCRVGGSASCQPAAGAKEGAEVAAGNLGVASNVGAILGLAIWVKMADRGVAERAVGTANCDSAADAAVVVVENDHPGSAASAVAPSGSGRIRVVASIFGCVGGEVPPQQNLLRLTVTPAPGPLTAGPAWLGTG